MNARRKMLMALGLSAGLFAVTGMSAWAVQEGKESPAKGKPAAAKIGEKAPAFTGKDLKGKDHKLADYTGKIVVLEWVNPDCPVCRGAHQDGRIKRMLDEFKAMDGVVFLAVNSTHYMTAEQNEQALQNYKIEYPVLLDNDGTIGKAYGARTTPHVFVIDGEGVLRYQGAIDDGGPGKAGTTNYAVSAVKQIKAGETVSPDHVKSYGCSVKYPPGEGAGKGGEGRRGRGNSGP